MNNTFQGQCILVTGSTRGIGRAIATDLLTQGATVGIHGRTEEHVTRVCGELAPAGDRTVPVAADLSDPANAVEAVRRFHETTGQLDGLVNNAGGGRAAAFRGMTLEKWRQTFAVNLDAAMIACREAYVIMRKRRAGAIVNVASLAGHGPGKWMGADYAASKAGLVSLTRSMAFEAGRLGIRVNAVSPGMVETDMTTVLSPRMRQDLGIPMGRLGTPGEVACAVSFLLSARASYMTGQVLHVNGGLWM